MPQTMEYDQTQTTIFNQPLEVLVDDIMHVWVSVDLSHYHISVVIFVTHCPLVLGLLCFLL